MENNLCIVSNCHGRLEYLLFSESCNHKIHLDCLAELIKTNNLVCQKCGSNAYARYNLYARRYKRHINSNDRTTKTNEQKRQKRITNKLYKNLRAFAASNYEENTFETLERLETLETLDVIKNGNFIQNYTASNCSYNKCYENDSYFKKQRIFSTRKIRVSPSSNCMHYYHTKCLVDCMYENIGKTTYLQCNNRTRVYRNDNSGNRTNICSERFMDIFYVYISMFPTKPTGENLIKLYKTILHKYDYKPFKSINQLHAEHSILELCEPYDMNHFKNFYKVFGPEPVSYMNSLEDFRNYWYWYIKYIMKYIKYASIDKFFLPICAIFTYFALYILIMVLFNILCHNVCPPESSAFNFVFSMLWFCIAPLVVLATAIHNS